MGSKSTEAYLLWYDILNRFTVMLAQRSAQLLGIVFSWMKAKLDTCRQNLTGCKYR